MFVFLSIILIKIIVVVQSTIEHISINESETTFTPINIMSNELEKAVHSLQTAIHLLMPKKNLINTRQSQLIKCLSNNEQLTEEEKNICQELLKNHNNNNDDDYISEDSNEKTQISSNTNNNQLNRKKTINQTWLNRTKINYLIEKLKNRARDNDEDNHLNLGQILSRTYQLNSSMNNDQTEFDTQSNKLGLNRWNLGRTRDLSFEKNLLLANLSQTLETLESIIDHEPSLKPADLISIIKNQKFSWKFLRFLDTIKTILDQSVSKNQFSSIN